MYNIVFNGGYIMDALAVFFDFLGGFFKWLSIFFDKLFHYKDETVTK